MEISELVNKMPDHDEHQFMSSISKEVVDNITVEVLKGGASSIAEVISMLVEPGKGEDYKARYLLHCLAIYVGKGREKQRQMYCRTLAGQLDKGHSKGVKKYLISELQVVAGSEVVTELGHQLNDDELCEPAAMALMAIGTGAQEQFRKALPKANEKCRLTISQNLNLLEVGR